MIVKCAICIPMHGPRGVGGWARGLSSPGNHTHIGFLSNTVPNPLKITKVPSQHSMLGHHWHASFAGGLMMALLYTAQLKFSTDSNMMPRFG